MEKIIKSFTIEKSQDYIRSRGETRAIKIYGTKGSGFSLEINDSSGDCILDNPLQNVEIPVSGVYTLNQKFPDISTSATGGLIEEYYDITLTPNADSGGVGTTTSRVYQYPDVTITLKTSTSQTGPGLTVSGGSDITIKAAAFENVEKTQTQTLVITEASEGDTAGFFYVKDTFNGSISKDTTFTRKIKADPEVKIGTNLILEPLTTRTINSEITQEINDTMSVRGTVTKEKIVHKSLDVETCKRATNRFELSDTVGLFPGMTCKVDGLHNFFIEKVECGKNIAVDTNVAISEDKKITFVYEARSSIAKIISQINEDGNACIELTTPINIVHGMSLELDDDKSRVLSASTFDGSGSNTVTLVNKLHFSNFEKRSVTHTLDLDNIITRTPNAFNIYVDVPKNSSSFSINTGDYDTDISTKTATATGGPFNGSISTSGRAFSYTPNNGYVGIDKILYTLSDGTNTSAEKEINITVK